CIRGSLPDHGQQHDADDHAHRYDVHARPGAAQLRQRAADAGVPDLPTWLPAAGQRTMSRRVWVMATICFLARTLSAQEPYRPPVVGRWDLTLTASDGRKLPSW